MVVETVEATVERVTAAAVTAVEMVVVMEAVETAVATAVIHLSHQHSNARHATPRSKDIHTDQGTHDHQSLQHESLLPYYCDRIPPHPDKFSIVTTPTVFVHHQFVQRA